jgi:hypothetical protein
MIYIDYVEMAAAGSVDPEDLIKSFEYWAKSGTHIRSDELKLYLGNQQFSSEEYKRLMAAVRQAVLLQMCRQDFFAAAEYEDFHLFLLERSYDEVSV